MSFIVYSSFVKSFECLKICMYLPWTCNFSLDPCQNTVPVTRSLNLDSALSFARPPTSILGVSSFLGLDGDVDLTEGFLITRTVKYTHQLAH
jgi:hypothetical protein